MKAHKNTKLRKVVVIGLVCIFTGTVFSPSAGSARILQNIIVEKSYPKLGDGKTEYYAIIAGCIKYKDPANDIPIGWAQQRFLLWSLLAAPNWKRKNIIVLFNDETDIFHPLLTMGGATRKNILRALDYMAKRVDGDDIFLFAWQGHGSSVEDDDGDEMRWWKPWDRWDEVICPYDTYTDKSGKLHNYIRDDELEEKFDNILCKGQCIILECCLSGGLIEKSVKNQFTLDVNKDGIIDPEEASNFSRDLGEDLNFSHSKDIYSFGRVVLVSALGETISRVTPLFGGPLTTGMAMGLLGQWRGSKKDRNHDGFISAEEAFRWAKPKIYAMISAMWFSLWLYFIAASYFYKETENQTVVNRLVGAIVNGTIYFFLEYVFIQLLYKIIGGAWGATIPHIIDGYPGELNIIELRSHKI